MDLSIAAGTQSRPRAASRSRAFAVSLAVVAGMFACAAVALAVENRVTPLAALEEYAVPTMAVGLSLSSVGTVVSLQRPRLPLGWYMQGAGLVCLTVPLAAQWARFALVTRAVVLPAGKFAATVAAFGWPVSAVLLFAGLPLVFPYGRPTGRIAWVGAVLAATALVSMSVGSGFASGPSANLPEVPNPLGAEGDWPGWLETIGVALVATAVVLAAISLILRYRRSGETDRVRIRMFVAAAVLLTLSETALPAASIAMLGAYPDWLNSLAETVFGAGLVVAVGVAVLRHHLHDIDVVVNRAVVYAAMTVVVTAVYVIIVGYAAAALGLRGTGPELAATIAAALCFEPARRRVQIGVNRLFYGQREDPGRLISRLDRHLEGVQTVDSLLSAVAASIVDGLRLPFAEAIAVSEDGTELTSAAGVRSGPTALFPVLFGHTVVGAVVVAPRQTERGLSERDRRALLEFARHAGPALYAARLSGELVGARARIVTAREDERSRLRRDLHDGIGAELGSQAIFLDAIRHLVRSDTTRAEQLLLQAREHTQAAVIDLRRVLDDLRPAVLDDHGLAAALVALADRYEASPLRVDLETVLEREPPPAIQAAVLRIVAECITNAVRHSGGTCCRIRVMSSLTSVVVTVQDDGKGLSAPGGSGVGLRSMRERAVELGGSLTVGETSDGGVFVSATIPCDRATP